MYEIIYTNWKKILISFFAVIFLIIGLSVLYISINNPHGEELQISNLSTYTKGKASDKDTLFQIKHSLYELVQRNTKEPIKSNSIDDVMIRDKSYNQKYDEKNHTHYVEFIVDIASIKQSYLVNYQWSSATATEDDGIAQYGNMVSCLPDDQLKYGTFHCQDLMSDMGGSEPRLVVSWAYHEDEYDNPIGDQLQPYETMFIEYQILGDYRSNHKLKKIRVDTDIKNVKRTISTGNTLGDTPATNTLRFDIIVEKNSTYEVFIDYDNGRYMSIKNTTTGKVIDRKTEVDY
jgi:sulfur relay (sulfurtransferase) DsrF/TusC family protein